MECNFLYKTSQEFCYVLSDVYNHDNTEQGYKEAFRWSFVLFPWKSWPGCFRVFSKDEEGAIPADEIKWSIFAWTSMITLSKVCNSAMFVMDLSDSLIWCACLCRFVLMHLPGIKVKVSRSSLFLRNEKFSCQPLIPRHKKVKVNLARYAKFSKEMKMKHIIRAKSEGDDHLT